MDILLMRVRDTQELTKIKDTSTGSLSSTTGVRCHLCHCRRLRWAGAEYYLVDGRAWS